jgi:hypothetical protein
VNAANHSPEETMGTENDARKTDQQDAEPKAPKSDADKETDKDAISDEELDRVSGGMF